MTRSYIRMEGSCHEKLKALDNNLRLLSEGSMTKEDTLDCAAELLAVPRHYGKEDLLLWNLHNATDMTGEAWNDFVWYASCKAVAALACAALTCPEVMELPRFREVLKRGSHDCVANTPPDEVPFLGHGYESVTGFMDCMEMFAKANMPVFIKTHGDLLSPAFLSAFKRAEAFLNDQLIPGNVRDLWSGETYSKRACEVLDALRAA